MRGASPAGRSWAPGGRRHGGPVERFGVPRYVGAAFVAQFSTSLAAGLLSTSMLSGDAGTVVAAVSADPERLCAVILLELLTALGITALTSLLYVALRDTVRWVATVAFALWLVESTVLAVSMLSLYSLLDLASASVGPGSALSAPDAAIGQAALGLHEHAADMVMLFFAAGAPLWYWLFLRTRFVPRWLSIWGSRVSPAGLPRNPDLDLGP